MLNPRLPHCPACGRVVDAPPVWLDCPDCGTRFCGHCESIEIRADLVGVGYNGYSKKEPPRRE